MADQDPVLVDQVVGGDVGVGPAEGLLQWVPLEGRHHVVLCQEMSTLILEYFRTFVIAQPFCGVMIGTGYVQI